jgi:hypothetical protein
MNERKFQVGDEVLSIQVGECVVEEINANNIIYPITIYSGGDPFTYTSNGKFHRTDKFPSLFHKGVQIIEAPVREKPKPEFKPFQKVLVRYNFSSEWKAAIFSHRSKEFFVANCMSWSQCIPYEGNEHLLGTTEAPQ